MFKEFLITVIFISLFSVVNSQNIPEEVRVKQYVNAKHKGAYPYPNGLYVIKLFETSGKVIHAGDTVTVHYEGRLLNNKVFDSSYERKKPITFVVGVGQVIEGWDDGLMLLKEGESATLIIPSQLGYGNQQVGPIPPNSPMVFKIEVLKVGN
jgi:peptidyl-prolyl cis-trans isomerase A (cyclophilin A)